MSVLTPALLHTWIPKRTKQANKGSSGRILIVAGSRGMAGAAVLSSMGAVQSGAGLIRLAVVKSIQPVIGKRAPLEVTSAALPETKEGHVASAATSVLQKILMSFRPDVIAIGPGLGVSSTVRSWMLMLLNQTEFPLVVDADALNVLTLSDFKKKRKAAWIMTPHPGELAHLFKSSPKKINEDRRRAAFSATAKTGAICLLKGHGTLVAKNKSLWENRTGNPAMASAGMGDVLTGMIAGLWGQFNQRNTETAARAACLGAYLHGKAGDMAHQVEGGLSLKASSLAAFIPAALKSIT